MKRFVMRYGVFAIISCMLVAIVYVACNFEIREKVRVSLCETGSSYSAYVPLPTLYAPQIGTSVTIVQTLHGNLHFVLHDIHRESSHLVLIMKPISSSRVTSMLNGDTYAEGYVYTGKKRLIDVILEKIRF